DVQPVSEDKGKEEASTAEVVSKKKRADKEKRKRFAMSESEKVTKKPITQKNKGPKVVRKLMVHEDDDEETEEEPLTSKRKRSEPQA
ncbi:hypothetical protein A2U01_0084606, partial [Trifolium medium]|nr:hypothetical protein [Trifolium medium]